MLSAKGLSAGLLVALIGCSASAWAQAPAPYDVTPAMVSAAQKEGKVVFYTAIELKAAESLAQAFEAKYPGIKVQVERSGAERNFQRIFQEHNANIHNADVIESSDPMNFLYFKSKGWITPVVPKDLALWPAAEKDKDGYYAVARATLNVIGYNTNLVKSQDAPKSHMDLLDPKWKGKIVKAHPSYSGSIMTDTYVLSKLLGWGYFEKLSKQNVLQIQSATVPPQKVAIGEREIMADGNEYVLFTLMESGQPIKPVYATEGSSLVEGNAAVFKDAPHPNAARLFYSYLFSQPAQQLLSDVGGLRSFNPNVKEKADRTPLSKIKLLHADPAGMERQIKTIKANYSKYFGG
jgi:iron(III) transport system substrate-binding protein